VTTNALERLQFSEGEKAYLKRFTEELKENWIKDKEQALANLKVRTEKVNERLNRLTDAYLEGALERDLFEERKGALLFERQAIQGKIKDYAENKTSTPQLLEQFLELAGNAWMLYQEAEPEQKRRMVKTITSNLTVRAKTVDFAYAIPFNEVASREKTSDGRPSWWIARTWKPILDRLLKHFADQAVD